MTNVVLVKLCVFFTSFRNSLMGILKKVSVMAMLTSHFNEPWVHLLRQRPKPG